MTYYIPTNTYLYRFRQDHQVWTHELFCSTKPVTYDETDYWGNGIVKLGNGFYKMFIDFTAKYPTSRFEVFKLPVAAAPFQAIAVNFLVVVTSPKI